MKITQSTKDEFDALKALKELTAKRDSLQRELDFVESEIEKTKFVLYELLDIHEQILSEL